MSKDKKSFMDKFLNVIETIGNKLPNPVILFVILCLIIIVVSHIFYLLNINVTYYGVNHSTLEVEEFTVYAVSLLSPSGIRHIFTTSVSNFVNFAPMGMVAVSMIGIGIAENSGLIASLIRKLVMSTPKKILTFSIVLLGSLSSVASSAGYLVLIPLGAAVFHSSGRHPIAGLAAAFAGVGATFAVNIFITPNDTILVGLANDAIYLIDPSLTVDITVNFFFSVVSTILLTIVAVVVTEKIIEPRLGKYEGAPPENITKVTEEEKKGLKFATIAFAITATFLAFLSLPSSAPLRNSDTGSLINDSPFMEGLVFTILIIFLIPGIAYGYGAKTIKNTNDIIKYGSDTMASLSGYFLLSFVISQFISYFNYSKINTIITVFGASTLEAMGLSTLPLIIGFIILTLILNLIISSSAAKWAIMAPVFIPMFIQLGISPAMTIAAYRIGDSVTNTVTPLMSFFPLIVVFAEKYDKNVGMGTLISTMLPYTIYLTISWTLLLVVWYILGIPLGPNAFVFMP